MASNNSEVSPIGWNAQLVNFFIENSRLTLLLLISLVIGGIFSLTLLHSEGFPSPPINVAVITDLYPGASSAEVERGVVKQLESVMEAVKGVKDVNSTSRDGFASLSATFDAGTDFNSALAELRTKISSAEIAKNADTPQVTVPEVGGNDSLYALVSNSSPESIRAAGEQVRQKLEAVSGVKEFKLAGTLTDQVVVRYRQNDLNSHGLTVLQVTQALAAANVSFPAGTVDDGGFQKTVVTNGLLGSVTDVANIVVGRDSRNQLVSLDQVADVKAAVDSDAIYSRVGYKNINNDLVVKNSLIYQLSYQKSSDLLKTDRLVQTALDDLTKGTTLGEVKIVAVFDVAQDTRKQIDEIIGGAFGAPLGHGPLAKLGYILGGIWLVILAMLVFVSWRAGLISALAIPLSFLFTFMFLKFSGTTLNTLTLFSLVLVLGLVVDPAIVVLEAIQQEIDLGQRGKDAVIAAINKIGSGVFMAAFTSIIVFVPFAIVSGVFGQIIKYIPITVIPALVASYFVPLLFLTFLGRRFLRPAKRAVIGDEQANLWAASRWFIRTNQAILSSRWKRTLVFWLLAVIIPFSTIVGLFASSKIHPVQFSAPPDSEQLSLSVEYRANSVTSDKIDIVNKLEPILAKQTEVKNYFVFGQQPSGSQLFVTLLPAADRTQTAQEVVTELNNQLTPLNQPDKGIFYKAEVAGVGPPEQAFPVSVNIADDNLDQLKAAAIKTGDLLRDRPDVTRVEDGFTNIQNPQLSVTLDPIKVKKYPISNLQIAQILSAVVGESKVTKFSQDIDGANRTVEVVLVNSNQPKTVRDLENTVIGTYTGGQIQIKDVATVQETQGFSGINHLNGQRYVTVQAAVKDDLKDGPVAQKAVTDFWTKDELAKFGLRPDALQNKGAGDEFAASFQNLFIALLISIVLTYVAFVIYFGSFAQPFIILFSIPLGLMGVFSALSLIGGQFGFLEILGVITLIGIVENVGIFLIDLANHRRQSGESAIDAISHATGIRFRPIFLTKLTALGGLLPLIIISPFWRSLGIVVVAGIITSGVLSLFVTPVLYCWFIWVGDNISRAFRRRFRSAENIG